MVELFPPFKLFKPLSLIAIFLLEATLITVCFAQARSDRPLCAESEQQALLDLKRDLVDPSESLSSWTLRTDCCKWERVVCDNKTSHVTKLRLGGGSFGGKISPSLIGLEHLTVLDLSSNDFAGASIPSFIGSLTSLRDLSLGNSGFVGEIPHQLGNLSRLVHLHVEEGYGLSSRSLLWLSGLTSLKFLGLSHVNLSEASDHWLETINKFSSLIELRLISCELGRMDSLPYVNFTSLKVLDLSLNHFYSVLPRWIFTLSKLVLLKLSESEFLGPFPNGSWSLNSLTSFDASQNSLNSSMPNNIYDLTMLESLNFGQNNLQGVVSSAIGNLSSLVSLNLGDNNRLEGEIPISIGHLCNLEELDLSGNILSGDISETFQRLFSGGCLLNSLGRLYLGGNLFTGEISDRIGELKNLAFLSLSSNKISGPIPGSLGKLSLLEYLDLSDNKLNETLPKSIGSLTKLRELDISGNFLEGILTEENFANLSSLTDLLGSRNSLSLKVGPHWNPPFRLSLLQLKSWKLGPKFPTWLKSQKDFLVIDISDAGISDAIPSWFWSVSLEFLNMNLSNNQIYGEIPSALNFNSRSSIYLGFNNLTGPLPQISSGVRVLDLSNNFFSGDISRLVCKPVTEGNSLTILRLENNLLSGNMSDCWSHWKSLEMINLGNNNLSGKIPISIGTLLRLQSLHLRNNSLSGEIPNSLGNCSMLKVVDLGLNMINGSIPISIGKYLSNLVFLGLRSNRLTGQIPRELCSLTNLQILDVANNNLFGTIPRCVGNFSAMTTKPQSVDPIFVNPFSFSEFLEDAFVITRGREDRYSTILTLLTSLDLSQNRLSGKIPQQLTALQGLISLNVSRNLLRGMIPDKIGDMTWIQSLDLSENQLEGRIPAGLSELHFLSHFDVSFNNLSGQIPQSTQIQSIEASSFSGNRFLCGPPLLKKCAEDDVTIASSPSDGETGEHEYELWLRIGLATGFGVGFVGVNAPLLLFGFWRRAYFYFFQEYVWYKILDCVLKYKRLMRAV